MDFFSNVGQVTCHCLDGDIYVWQDFFLSDINFQFSGLLSFDDLNDPAIYRSRGCLKNVREPIYMLSLFWERWFFSNWQEGFHYQLFVTEGAFFEMETISFLFSFLFLKLDYLLSKGTGGYLLYFISKIGRVRFFLFFGIDHGSQGYLKNAHELRRCFLFFEGAMQLLF